MTEAKLHEHICFYLEHQYPDVLFTTDMSGVKLPIGLAKKVAKLRSTTGIPDILIFQTKGKKQIKGETFFKYAGLFLEVKKETPFKKCGMKLKKNKHTEKQANIHKLLRKQGYAACFVWDFDQAVKIINNYLAKERK